MTERRYIAHLSFPAKGFLESWFSADDADDHDAALAQLARMNTANPNNTALALGIVSPGPDGTHVREWLNLQDLLNARAVRLGVPSDATRH